MFKEMTKKKKWIIIILSCVLAVAVAAGSTVWYFVSNNNNQPTKKKNKGVVIITEEQIDELPEGILDGIDIETPNNNVNVDNMTDNMLGNEFNDAIGDNVNNDDVINDDVNSENTNNNDVIDNVSSDNVNNNNVNSENENNNDVTNDNVNSESDNNVSSDNTNNDVSGDNTNNGDVNSDNSNSDNNSDNISSDNVSSDNISSDNVSSDNVSSDNVSSDNVSSDNVSSDNVSSDNVSSDNVSSDNVSSDDSTDDPKEDLPDIFDQEDFEDEETDYLLSVLNKESVNDKFMGFGAVYYPWLFWEDSLGRNYTDEQAKIELDRLVESGTTWIRSVVYARPEWYNKTNDEWIYSGAHYDGLVKFFKEIDKRGVEVMLNFEWGESIQDTYGVFSNSTLKAYPTDQKVKMYGDFCASFTQALKDEGINCVKYITFFSEPSNRKEQGMLYDTEAFEEVHVKKIVPFYTSLLKSVNDAFTSQGIRNDYKFIGNNQSSAYNTNMYTWQQFKPMYDSAKEYLDEYSYHLYNYVSSPKGVTYDDFAYVIDTFVDDVETNLGIKANETWFDEINVAYNGTSGPVYEAYKKYGTGIYALKDDPYTATQLSNTLLSLLNSGYKTASLWTFTSNLWPDSTQMGGSFWNGVFLCGVMPNLMESQVPYNTYYTYSLISRYCNNAKSVYAGDNFFADSMASSCVYDKDGNITVYVVNSNLYDVEYKLEFEDALDKKVMYRHLYDPQTFEGKTTAKPIGVDRVFINVSGGFVDTIPAGAVAVYTTSKK